MYYNVQTLNSEVEKETDSEEEEEAEQTKIKNQLEEMRFEQNRDQKK